MNEQHTNINYNLFRGQLHSLRLVQDICFLFSFHMASSELFLVILSVLFHLRTVREMELSNYSFCQ